MHKNPNYGVASLGKAPLIIQFANQVRPASILDYGAGKGRLYPKLKGGLDFAFDMRYYDPAIPIWTDRPEPAEMVVCIDVLEHIEPDFLESVLDDLARVTAKIGVFTVATGPAQKVSCLSVTLRLWGCMFSICSV